MARDSNQGVARAAVVYRDATEADAPFLWQMLALSSYASVDDVQHSAELQRYIAGWQRAGDFGVIAETVAGAAIGAAWSRRFSADDAPYYFLPDAPDEIVIAVRAEARRQGIARELLRHLIARADARGLKALSLNVRTDNPAIALYRAFGFTDVTEVTNRVGSRSLIMRRTTAHAERAR